MKRVVFIRHAKSSWKNPKLSDLERPLNQRGERDVKNMGLLFKKEALQPDLIISSHAIRAQRTALGIAQLCGYQNKIVVNENLYFKGVSAIFRQINQLSENLNHIWLFFHNPDINHVVIGKFGAAEDNIPTLGCVFTESSSAQWSNWSESNTKIVRIVKPKNLLG